MRSIQRSAAASLAALALAAPLAAQSAPAKANLPPDGTALVFVNTQAILPVAPGADAAQAAFQNELRGFEGELQRLATEIDSLVQAYRRQESLLDADAKSQKQQEILGKQRSAQSRQLELEEQSDRRRNELLAPILKKVTEVIEEIRAERGYSIVFDIAESGVVAADEALDITAAVLERLGVSPTPGTAGSGR